MNRASPVDLRKALEATHILVKAGILFVPMPVTSPEEYSKRVAEMNARMNEIVAEAEVLP